MEMYLRSDERRTKLEVHQMWGSTPMSLSLQSTYRSQAVTDFMVAARDDEECDRRLIAVHIPHWVRRLVQKGDQLTAILDDDNKCRWLINNREALRPPQPGEQK